MSSHVVVIDKSARRYTIKVSPDTILNSILLQACKKVGIQDTSNYGLKHNNKTLDLSLPYRFTNLAQGAKLELIQLSRGRGDSDHVTVALQLMEGNGERLTQRFPTSTSIWSILRTFEVTAASNGVTDFSITELCNSPSADSGSGRLFYRMPVIQIVNRELGSFEEFQQTLASMGYSGGTVLLRLKHKDTDIPLEDAVELIASFANAHPPVQLDSLSSAPTTAAIPPSVASSGSGLGSKDAEIQETTTPTQIPMDSSDAIEQSVATSTSRTNTEYAQPTISPPVEETTPAEGTTPTKEMTLAGPISVKVFKPPERSTPHAATVDVSDEDFEPNIAQLQKVQIVLQEAGRPQRLLSNDELREKERLAKEEKEKIPEVEVKVRFPDQSMIQATLKSANTAEDLYNFVRSCLRHPAEPFYLYQTPPVRRIFPTQGRLVLDCQFTRRTLINFAWEAEDVSNRARAEPPLSDKYIAAAQAIEIPKPIEGVGEEDTAAASKGKGKAVGSATPGSSKSGIGSKVPKWFKLPGKK